VFDSGFVYGWERSTLEGFSKELGTSGELSF
jgi:hypothetical protein